MAGTFWQSLFLFYYGALLNTISLLPLDSNRQQVYLPFARTPLPPSNPGYRFDEILPFGATTRVYRAERERCTEVNWGWYSSGVKEGVMNWLVCQSTTRDCVSQWVDLHRMVTVSG